MTEDTKCAESELLLKDENHLLKMKLENMNLELKSNRRILESTMKECWELRNKARQSDQSAERDQCTPMPSMPIPMPERDFETDLKTGIEMIVATIKFLQHLNYEARYLLMNMLKNMPL